MFLLYNKIKTGFSLGVFNVFRVITYRLKLVYRIHPVQYLDITLSSGMYFSEKHASISKFKKGINYPKFLKLFGYWLILLEEKSPNWTTNPFTDKKLFNLEKDWWVIDDFDPVVGDIKKIWELSRFDWVVLFAQRAYCGKNESIKNLNNWLNEWNLYNKPYKGPNWKCGQEASIRVIHLAVATKILIKVEKSSDSLIKLIELHIQRIVPTFSYAIGQDNNHGISEAAALFIGGNWIQALGISRGKKWSELGRKWIEKLVNRLISEDGSFSQYSLNYHRLMLDTLCFVEIWRKELKLPQFSSSFYKKVKSATFWLYAFTSPYNGNGPNLGANDGARLMLSSNSDYRDFRPSVQLAATLFLNAFAYPRGGNYDQTLFWMGLEPSNQKLQNVKTKIFDKGGVALLVKKDLKVFFYYPRFKFRPSQADALHVDLWIREKNILRDSGTYSYVDTDGTNQNFLATRNHNTIEFDQRNQMPRISRFLFGNWLKTDFFKPLSKIGNIQKITAGYQDYKGAKHIRSIELSTSTLIIYDKVQGFLSKATLRWHLIPGQWKLNLRGCSLTNGNQTLCIVSQNKITRFELVEAWESLYYGKKEKVPVLEVEINKPGIIKTTFLWKK